MLLSFTRSQGTRHTWATQSLCRGQEASAGSEEQEGNSDVETALAALAGESDIELEATDVQEILCWLIKCHDSRVENSG